MAVTDDQAERAKFGKVVAKAWSDAAFKAKLLSDPSAALSEAGVDVPAGVTVVVEDTKSVRHLVLPEQPEGELSDEALDNVAGGAARSKVCTCR